MKNPGWLITILSLPLIAVGVVFLTINFGTTGIIIGSVLAGLGALTFIGGFSRLIQGKNRKIMGQLIRPKAAARGSAVWAFFCINITPLLLGNNALLEYLQAPPLPLVLLLGPKNIVLLAYMWLPAVMIILLIFWVIGMIFSAKIPKIYNIYNNFIITICFTFWLNFGSQFFLWAVTLNKDLILLMDPWKTATTIQEVIVPLAIGGAVVLVSLIFTLRSLNKLQQSFLNLNISGKTKIIMIVALVVVYSATLFPLYFSVKACITTTALLVSYLNYIPLIFMAIVAFSAISSLSSATKNISTERIASGESGSKSSFGIKTALMVMVLILMWLPIVYPVVDGGENKKTNSIYNPLWNGWSNFREALEADTEDGGYTVMSVQSSLSTISQLDKTKQVILVIPGPNVFYNPAAEVPYLLEAFSSNFSMFICDDHGTTETLMTEMFAASIGVLGFEHATPLTFFPKGILYENNTYSNGDPMYWKNPTFPIISDFPAHEINQGIDQVVLGQATAFLGGSMLNMLGWNFIGQTSGSYSYIDTSGDGMYDPLEDVYTLGGNIGDVLTSVSSDNAEMGIATTMLKGGFPLGGYEQAVFSTKDMGVNVAAINGVHSNRVFCATDASWLNNELTSIDEFDNLQMGLNAMDWLTCGRAHSDVIVVFDEAHITLDEQESLFGVNLAGRTEINSAASFGAVQGYVNWLSTNPILGLVYPLFALQTLRKWIPKEGNKKKIQLKDLEAAEREKSILKFRTSSFFAQKINWYRQHKKYNQALLQLYRRMERKLNRLLGNSGDRSIDAILRAIRVERGKYLSKDHFNRIKRFLEMMFDIKRNKTVIKEEREFETLFMEMSWVNDHI
ncbi:hypothetical protein NEF87_004459 [Candidatus Lokiarchaeum ossiferum]|uniref:DUF4350 domain-containing protein n=1 Tax=Candidatus Lokiarchaeum ossiferum TaxID=2951803 RepID=A0ABY6HXC2_9ARCH|nr:hypothetical protein NEF87_004459 [Candidatus Lokiarchaeum sp. B-35]